MVSILKLSTKKVQSTEKQPFKKLIELQSILTKLSLTKIKNYLQLTNKKQQMANKKYNYRLFQQQIQKNLSMEVTNLRDQTLKVQNYLFKTPITWKHYQRNGELIMHQCRRILNQIECNGLLNKFKRSIKLISSISDSNDQFQQGSHVIELIVFTFIFNLQQKIKVYLENLLLKQFYIFNQLIQANKNKPANILSMTEPKLQMNTMYVYSQGKNIPWNMTEYKPQTEYYDSNKLKNMHKKQEENYLHFDKNQERHVTKKPFFIDQLIKPVKLNPSPGMQLFQISDKYSSKSIFDQTKNKKKSKNYKVNPRLLKYTYLDTIQIQSKMHKQPGVGKYSLTKNQKQIKEEIKAMSKKKFTIDENRHFYDGNQANSILIPGAGKYNPHLTINHPPKINRQDYKFWIDKHKKMSMSERKKLSKEPAPTSYRPLSASFRCFSNIQKSNQQFQKKNKGRSRKSMRSGFGSSDSKFQYTRQPKRKIQEKRPSPNKYQTTIQWKGKDSQPNKKGWARCLSAGPKRSIYH